MKRLVAKASFLVSLPRKTWIHGVFITLVFLLFLGIPFRACHASPSAHRSNHHKAPSRTSLYDCLGVDPSCSAKDLKKAYRRKALKCHPDKQGGDEAAFKELSRAYDILSDPDKRAVYDRYGEAGLDPAAAAQGGSQQSTRHQQQQHPHTNLRPEDLFRHFSRQQQQHSHNSHGGTSSSSSSFSFGSSSGGGLNIDLESLLREMAMGGGVGGGGGRQGNFGFGGTTPPSRQQTQKQPPQTFERPLYCTLEDLATGKSKRVKIQMPHGGPSRVVTVHLQKGWKAGTKIKFAATRDFPAVTLVVHEKPHKTLQRRGHDLVYRVPPGTELVHITLPDGEVWERRLPRTTTMRKGEEISIAGKGMPIKGGPERGNLILEFS